VVETRDRLAELCRDHRLGTEMIEQCQDLDQVLDRALTECERLIEAKKPAAKQRLQQLHGLLQLVREASAMQSQGAVLDELGQKLESAVELDHGTQRVTVPVDIELLGELFASVARLCHKINNPLTSIMGRAQMLQMKVQQGDGDEKLGRSVEVIEESSKRVAALVQELANLICQGRKEFVEHYDSSSGSL